MERRYGLNFINGEWRPATDGSTVPNINPSCVDDVIGQFADSTAEDASVAVEAAEEAGATWRDLGPVARGALIYRSAELLAERATEFAAAIVREQGKLTREALAEVTRSGEILKFLAGEARRLNGATMPADDSRTFAYTYRAPLGAVGLITPWNFPLAIPAWKTAAALVAGCTVVLKPSPLAPWTSALLAEVFHEAGLPAGVLNLLLGGREAGTAIVAHPRIAGVSFTGSVPVGLAIQTAAAPRLLPTQLELGGNNAVLVLPDADLDAAADAVVSGAFGQAGQRCSATSRVIVDTAVFDKLLTALVERARRLRVGPADNAGTDMGPVVSDSALRRCRSAVEQARAHGARIRSGDEPLPAELPAGHFMRPVVMSDVPADSDLVRGEVFGPVVSVIVAKGAAEAVSIANSVPYGLSAAVFTRDLASAHDTVQRLKAGMVHVNRPTVGAYAHMPHMGTKMSQFGPPECSPEVMDFFTELRSVCLRY